MIKTPLPNNFTPGEIEGFRIVFEMHLRDIAQARKAAGEPYPDEVKELLDAAMTPLSIDKDGEIVASNDRLKGVRKHPVSFWVVERCYQDAILEEAWSIRIGKAAGLDAWAQPDAVQKLMQRERAWRTRGQYALTCYKILAVARRVDRAEPDPFPAAHRGEGDAQRS